MRTLVKVCCIASIKEADIAITAGADAIGPPFPVNTRRQYRESRGYSEESGIPHPRRLGAPSALRPCIRHTVRLSATTGIPIAAVARKKRT
jgi:hypothetical protein